MAVPNLSLPSTLEFSAKPYAFSFPPRKIALLMIDMQRDFLLEGGFGEIEGGDLSAVQASILPNTKLLETARKVGMPVFHTREGHKPDLSDCPSSKLYRQPAAPGSDQYSKGIGDVAKMGRLLIKGEYGQDIVDELQPWPNEVVIDKPGRGAFWNTPLFDKLKAKGITHLFISGVTTECCVDTTFREANDRGFECCAIEEATAGYHTSLKSCILEIFQWSEGLFGFVGKLDALLECFAPFISGPTASQDRVPQIPPMYNGDLSISELQECYRHGESPMTVLKDILARIERYSAIDPAVWVYRVPQESILEQVKQLQTRWPDAKRRPPLFGVPFSVKDSIDVAGVPTTTACPSLRRLPTKTARVCENVLSQGAILVGKTNLDQLATGLTGCRSPFGYPRSVFNQEYIAGGSSSGSCVSVGADLVSFSIATDTAGSARVPSGFNGVVGFKSTKGLLSAQGVTPACMSLDSIAIIAHNVKDARTVWDQSVQHDENDPYAKTSAPIQRHVNSIGPTARSFRFGIPPPEALEVCSLVYQNSFGKVVEALQQLGGVLQPGIPWEPFEKAGKLMYEGSFVCERLANLPNDWLAENQSALHPVTRSVFSEAVGRNPSAIQAFRDLQAKALYTRQVEKVFEYSSTGVDVVVVPTAPTHWTVDEVSQDPMTTNTVLGEFSHFANVLDLCAIAVPAATYPLEALRGSGNGELPFSVTFLSGSKMDSELLEIAYRFEQAVASIHR